MRELKSEIIRVWSMPESYLALIPVSILSLVFSILNIDIFNAIITGDPESQNLDPSLLAKPIQELMLEGYLGPVYQASIIFIPLSVAFLFHLEYRSGDHDTIWLTSGNLTARKGATLICWSFWLLAASLLAAVVNFVASYLLIAPAGRELLSIWDAFVVYSRVAVFALLFSALTLFIGVLTRRLFVTVLVILGLLFVSLSGIFKNSIPVLHESLPLIGGKPFAFFDPSEGALTISQSAALLACWILVSGIGYLLLAVWGRR